MRRTILCLALTVFGCRAAPEPHMQRTPEQNPVSESGKTSPAATPASAQKKPQVIEAFSEKTSAIALCK